MCDTHLVERGVMFPTKILLAVDGSKETPSTERAAIELASGTGSEVHVVHVVSTVPELPYPHLAAKERSEAILEWRKLKGLEFLDDRVRRIGEDLGGTVAASYYREGRPEEELLRLGREIDAGLIMMGGRRRTRLERAFGANSAEKVLRRADRPVLVVDGRGSRGSVVPR
jgi:nucleotide-binding universal stress UspA family protein